MEKVNFGAVSLRDYVKDFGLDVGDFLEYISNYVTWGDEAVKYVLLDPAHVGAWLSDFMVATEKDDTTRKIAQITHIMCCNENQIAYFFL